MRKWLSVHIFDVIIVAAIIVLLSLIFGSAANLIASSSERAFGPTEVVNLSP